MKKSLKIMKRIADIFLLTLPVLLLFAFVWIRWGSTICDLIRVAIKMVVI